MLRSAITILALVLASCEMTPKAKVSEPVLVPDTEQKLTSQEDPLPAPRTGDTPDKIDHHFCTDSIYGKFLQKKYSQEAQKKLRGIRSWSKRRSFKRSISHISRHRARHRLAHSDTNEISANFPIVINEKVEKWIHYFEGRGKITFMKWMVRRASYREILVPLLQEEGLPSELEFLAMIESGFNNIAYSRARATGTWQFMAATARVYGLKVNYWIDERRDPVKSTRAAARYLKDLYEDFGDWYLAISAYNAGPGKIRRAMRKLRTRNFWSIANSRYIRTETKNYIPKMLAAMIIASEPEKHGFEIVPSVYNFTPQATVDVAHPSRLEEIASKLAIPPKILKRWNPELIKNITPPLHRIGGKPYPLRIPSNYVARFMEVAPSLERLSIKDVQMHRIRPGETLSQIARIYRVSVQKILRMNPNLRPRLLRPGRKIAIPIPAVVSKKNSDTA